MNTKRSSGESSIYRDDQGRWPGYMSMGLKDNGRRDRRHVSGDLQLLYADRLAAGCSATSVRHLHRFLHRVFDQGCGRARHHGIQ